MTEETNTAPVAPVDVIKPSKAPRKRKPSPRKKKGATAEPSTALALMAPEERASALLKFEARKVQLESLAKQSERITTITNTAGRDECHSARMTLKASRIAITGIAKEAREDATKFSKAVIAKEKELVAIIEPEEERLQAIQDAWESAREEERQAKLRIEAERIQKENDSLEAIRNLPLQMVGCASADIIRVGDALMARDLAAEFDEQALPRAEEIRGAAALKLKDLAVEATKREDLQRQLDEERAARAREQTEQAARDAKRAEDDAAERDRQAAAQRERDEADRKRREKENIESEHVSDIRSIPARCVGMTATQLEVVITDTKGLNPSGVIQTADTLALALSVRDQVVVQLQQMRDQQVQAETDAKARLERESAERAQAEEADAAERTRARDARMAELKAGAPPLREAALDALALLNTAGLDDNDVTWKLRFAVERDAEVSP